MDDKTCVDWRRVESAKMLYLIPNMNPQAIKIPDQNYDVLLDSTIPMSKIKMHCLHAKKNGRMGKSKINFFILFYFIWMILKCYTSNENHERIFRFAPNAFCFQNFKLRNMYRVVVLRHNQKHQQQWTFIQLKINAFLGISIFKIKQNISCA